MEPKKPQRQLDRAKYEQACAIIDELIAAADAERKEDTVPATSDQFKQAFTKLENLAKQCVEPLLGLVDGVQEMIIQMDKIELSEKAKESNLKSLDLPTRLRERKDEFCAKYERIEKLVEEQKAKKADKAKE